MIYFIIPLLLTIYFEFLGRWILYKFNKTAHIYFPIGLIAIIAIIYPSLLITINNLSFYVILTLNLIIILTSIFLIIRDFKHLDRKFTVIDVISVLTIAGLLTYYSINTSLGNLHGFDTLYYINFTINNIGKNVMNSKGVYLNGPLEESLTYYTGQTYYYFAGVIIYLFGKVCALFKIEYFYETAFIWIFQIIFNLSFSAIIVETFHRLKNKLLAIVPGILLVFMLGKVYFNNIYGFFGNSLLLISVSYATLFIYDYLNNKDINNRYLIYTCLISGCSFSSSGIYILLFVLVGLFFFIYGEKDILKEYAIVAFFPLLNVLNMERLPLVLVFIIPLLVFLILFFGDSTIKSFASKCNIQTLLFICVALLFVFSRIYSDSLFDFSGLLNNSSQIADMSLDYFHLNGGLTLVNIYKVFVIINTLLAIAIGRKKPFFMFLFVLILIFFNPFTCNFINHFISVYYRAYAIILNPFVIMVSFDSIASKISNIYFRYAISILLILLFVMNIDFIHPSYYHFEHKPKDDYNHIYKMSNDRIDIIRELKSEIDYYKEEYPYIITDNLLSQGIINDARYLFGREYYQAGYWTNNDIRLFEIFYPPEYLGDKVTDNPDYNNMYKYITNAKVNYIVVDKTVEYYDKDKKDYSYLFYKVSEVCNTYPVYENDTYVIYHF